MAQQRKKGKSSPAPAYTSDAMVAHLAVGLLLLTLGVVIFLAVGLNLAGDVFAGLRQVCYGLMGGLAFLFPVLPLWGGGLVMYATQRKAPLRPFVLTCVLFLLALTLANLIALTGNPAVPLLDYLMSQNQLRASVAVPDAFDVMLARSYEISAQSHMGGGLLGMLLAWPLWKTMGVVLAAVVTCLLIIADVLVLIRFNPQRVLARLRESGEQRRIREEQEQRRLREQELAWQRQRELAARAAAQQQYQQQMMQPPAPADPNYYYAPPARQEPAYPGYSAMPQESSVGFQPTAQELGGAPMQRTAPRRPVRPADAEEKPRRKSRLFGGEPEQEPVQDNVQDTQPRRKSRLFGGEPKQEPVQGNVQDTQPRRKSRLFGGEPEQTPVQDNVQDTQLRRKSRLFGGEPEQVPVQEFVQPVQVPPVPQNSYLPQELPVEEDDPPMQEASAPSPRRPQPEWEEEPPARNASWRSGESWQSADAPSRASDRPAAKKQPPLPSWTETPPWEDTPAPETPRAAVKPVLQQEPPKDAWKPELKLPPRREAPAEQTALPLPPPYIYPGLELIKQPAPQAGVSPEEDAMRSRRLEETLVSFRVPAKVVHVTHGPAISRFELKLEPGIKVSKVTDLGRNIAMNMEVKSVRIEAPIPGKSLVGVEVPNRETATVTLREVLESDRMRDAKSPLMVALGKDIAGVPIVCDLAKMPHLLIAGATGSGKSVCINTMINSLLYRCSPQEVRLILVDPKVVELQCYNGLPHLLIPVVSDPHKAAGALAWAVAEMMDRYKKFQLKGVRAINGYNQNLAEGETFMPRIVIIIDELADLMMTCKKDVEDHICRLAQLARAAGIHLVVATQRPSVDVITGLIKANIPSRIAFKVSSFVDSRTILDRGGAEQLLGYGDMLYLPTGEFTPIRVQGCFMSDGEVNRVTDFIRENCPSDYDPNVIEQLEQLEREAAGATSGGADVVDGAEVASGDGSLLAQCIEMAVQDGQVSTSLIQRRFKLGYARAGRIVDEMEKRGIVSAKDGAKPRMCLISREEYEQMKQNGQLEE